MLLLLICCYFEFENEGLFEAVVIQKLILDIELVILK